MPRPEHTEARQEAWISQVNAWTVEQVKSAIFSHECGDFANSALIAEALDRNPRISAALDTRCKGVVGLPFDVEPADESAAAQDIAAELNERWWDLFPESLLSDVLRWIVVVGLCPAELIAERDESAKRWLPRVLPWHPTNWRHDETDGLYKTFDRRGEQFSITPGDGWWVMFAASVSRPWMRGIVRCLGIDDSMRGLAVTDWARWSERHGIPIALAKLPLSAVSTDAGKAFASDVRTMGGRGVVRLPQGDADAPSWDLSFLEPKTLSWQGFKELIEHADRDVSIAILGQTLTTEVKGGSLAAAQVHELVRQDYIRADVRGLETTLREQVLKPYVRWNFGDAAVARTPWPRWDTRRPTDTIDTATTLDLIGDAVAKLKQASDRVDVDAILASFQIPMKGDTK